MVQRIQSQAGVLSATSTWGGAAVPGAADTTILLKDAPLVVDQNWTVGGSPVASPTAKPVIGTAGAVATSLPTGTYAFHISFVGSDGTESGPSPLSATQAVTSGTTLLQVSTPAFPAGISTANIYATDGASSADPGAPRLYCTGCPASTAVNCTGGSWGNTFSAGAASGGATTYANATKWSSAIYLPDYTQKAITGAVSNGAGGITITANNHGYANGDYVFIDNVPGCVEANNWPRFALSATANNGSGAIRVTFTTNHGLNVGDRLTIAGVVETKVNWGQNTANGNWIVGAVPSAAAVDLKTVPGFGTLAPSRNSVFENTYVSGGTACIEKLLAAAWKISNVTTNTFDIPQKFLNAWASGSNQNVCRAGIVVNPGVTLTYRGDVITGNTPIALVGNAKLQHDSSASTTPTATQYVWGPSKNGGGGVGVSFNIVCFAGSAGSRGAWISVTANSALLGFIGARTFSSGINQHYFQFTDISIFGSASQSAYTNATWLIYAVFHDCTFTTTGQWDYGSTAGSNKGVFSYQRCTFSGSLTTPPVHMSSNAAVTTGMTEFVDCSVDLGWLISPTNGLVQRCYIADTLGTASPQTQPNTVSGCFFDQTGGASGALHPSGFYNSYFLGDRAANDTTHWHLVSVNSTTSQPWFSCNVLEYSGADPAAQGFGWGTGNTAITAKVMGNIFIPPYSIAQAAIAIAQNGTPPNISPIIQEHNTFGLGWAVGQFNNALDFSHSGSIATGAMGNAKANILVSNSTNKVFLVSNEVTPGNNDCYPSGSLDYNAGIIGGQQSSNRAGSSANGTWYDLLTDFVPGGHDIFVSSFGFVDSTRRLAKWGSILHATNGTNAAAIALLAADVTKIDELLIWTKTGWKPTEAKIEGASYPTDTAIVDAAGVSWVGAPDMGAMSWVEPGSVSVSSVGDILVLGVG